MRGAQRSARTSAARCGCRARRVWSRSSPVPSAAPRPMCPRRGSATSTAAGPPRAGSAVSPAGSNSHTCPSSARERQRGVHHIGLGRGQSAAPGAASSEGITTELVFPERGGPRTITACSGSAVTQRPPGVNPRNAPPPRPRMCSRTASAGARRRGEPLEIGAGARLAQVKRESSAWARSASPASSNRSRTNAGQVARRAGAR